jgi:spore germination protein YaaH
VFGFLPYWELADVAPTLDFDQLTTLAWFGVEAHPQGRLVRRNAPGWAGWTSEAFADLKAQAQARGVRVVLTVQRFSWSAGQRRRTLNLLRCAPARLRLAQQIVDEIKAAGADGVNLDFEPLPGEVRDQFTAFVRDLRTRLDAARPGLQLTFDVTSDVTSYDLPALVADDAADAVLLMGYDYRVASAAESGSLSPVDNPSGPDLRESVGTILSVAPAEHIILGLPWYGRAWSTRGPEAHSPTRTGSRISPSVTAWYDVALDLATEGGRQFDPVEVSAWTAYVRRACDRCPETWRQLWYDDVDSFRAKVELALFASLRGIGIWALGYSGARHDLWTALSLAKGEIGDEIPPTGEARLDPVSRQGQRNGLPVVRDVVRVELGARDDPDGTGLAFVRLSNTDELDDFGELVEGVTYPVVDSVPWSLIRGSTQRPPVTRPRATPRARPRATPTRRPAAARPSERRISVQWRDIAGNWSEPEVIRVWHRPGGGSAPAPTPSSEPSPTFPATAEPDISAEESALP